jgi:hypothetical protein
MKLGDWRPHARFQGVKERYINDDDYGIVRHLQQDAEPVIDAVTRERNETGGWNADRTMKKVASVPAIVYYDWVAEWQMKGMLPPHHHPEFSRMCNELVRQRVRDGDYAKFRV